VLHRHKEKVWGWAFFLKGLIIGLSLAIPVGPIGLLCIRRTLARGRISGFFSGLGAATADGMYGAVAGFGLTFVSRFKGLRIVNKVSGTIISAFGLMVLLSILVAWP